MNINMENKKGLMYVDGARDHRDGLPMDKDRCENYKRGYEMAGERAAIAKMMKAKGY